MISFFDMIDGIPGRSQASNGQPRMGVVTSSDPATGTAKVLIQPEGVLTGWLPILTQWSGAGWGIACPPSPGDQVLVVPQEGDTQHGVIVGRIYSNSVRPPESNIGEIVLKHQSGSSLRLLNSGIVRIDGDLHVTGDVYDMHGSISRLRSNYNNHVHLAAGGQSTSAPTPQDQNS